MKYSLNYCILFTVCLLASCKKESSEPILIPEAEEVQQIEALPFTVVSLNDLSAFKPKSQNWNIVGNVIADRDQDKTFSSSEGSGILLNTNDQEKNKHIFTTFVHGDIEIELDVMMPVNSNSGLYFQGRYEIQLFDSWGVEHPKYSDMGGIYQRWDKTKEKGKEGYEGHAPESNVAKSPGLWQHFKIIFHAPKFDDAGNKTKNAWFEEVWLNGVLIQKNVEVTGPTRAAKSLDEKPKDALMLQGDHGPVAFKNIKYKLYEDKAIAFKNVILKSYDNPDRTRVITNLDSLDALSEVKIDEIDPIEDAGSNAQKFLSYSGILNIPSTGDYLFDIGVYGGSVLLIDNDTIINLNGYSTIDDLTKGKVTLEAGDIPFKLLYNKMFPWQPTFEIHVEGPEIQRYSMKKASPNVSKSENMNAIMVDASKEIKAQRSFLIHKGNIRTHCISVGYPEGIHYSYDLGTGSLLQVWSGGFLNTTEMWHSRGQHQTGSPDGFTVSIYGDLDFAFLDSESSIWPKIISDDLGFKQIGYDIYDDGIPVISYKIGDAIITHKMIPSKKERYFKRVLSVDSNNAIWHKIAEGESIALLPDGTYIINNESYFVDFTEHGNLKPIIRKSNGKDELIVKIPSGKQTINYSIIW